MSGKADGLQAIRRALKLVRLVAETQRMGARPTELARCAGLNVATTSRILRGLTEQRLLQYDERTRSYRMGPLAYELGLAARREAQLFNRLRPLLQQIADATGETAYLVARSGAEAVCLGYVAATSAIRAIPFETGDRLPLGIGAGSLALLAALGDDEVAAVLSENRSLAEAYGPHARPDAIAGAVALARGAGYAFTANMAVPGLANSTFRTAGVGVHLPASSASTAQLAISLAFVVTDNGEEQHRHFAAIIQREIARYLASQPSR